MLTTALSLLSIVPETTPSCVPGEALPLALTWSALPPSSARASPIWLPFRKSTAKRCEATASISRPVNAGWPYCIGPNLAYNDFNFATSTSGSQFNCAAPTNNSPNNTGQTQLPPAVPAQIYYHFASDPAHFPQLSGGAPMAGPVYRFDPNLASARKWPVDFDGRAIFESAIAAVKIGTFGGSTGSALQAVG